MLRVWSTVVIIICLASPGLRSCAAQSLSDEAIETLGEASVPSDADADADDAEGLHLFESARDRLLRQQAEMKDNYSDLQRRFVEANGREFTEDELAEAIAKAEASAPHRSDPAFPSNRWMFMRDIPPRERRRLQKEHKARRLASRNLQTVRTGRMVIANAASPGWSFNSGRNLFWCATLKKVARTEVKTQRRQKLTVKNCYITPEIELVYDYNQFNEMRVDKLDTIFYDWCLESDSVRINQPVRLNHCNVYSDTQLWDLIGADKTWRPELDTDLCVTCKYGTCASHNPRMAGGKLKFLPCKPEIMGPNPHRTGQVWYYCYISTGCEINANTNYLQCNLSEYCE